MLAAVLMFSAMGTLAKYLRKSYPMSALILVMGLLVGSGHLMLIRAMEDASPATLAPFIYSQLVWFTGLAYLAFGDFPDTVTLIRMVVIVSARLLAVNWQHMRGLSDASDQSGTH